MARRGLRDILPDLNKKLSADYNTFIQLALEGLATKDHSPVYTGFFASSWKASTQRTKPTDRVQDFQPWAQLRKRRDKGDTTAYRIAPRFTKPAFRYTDKVFIGNSTQYAAYALENPKVAAFVQGQLRPLLESSFNEKRAPQLLVGTSKGTGGLGFLGGREYVSYEKV